MNDIGNAYKQLTLFEDVVGAASIPSDKKGSAEVFRDYDSFIAKFRDLPKTTDDCYTPRDVYEAVVEFVSMLTDLSEKVIIRPFYPGGDYERAEYPDNAIVIDNPPFSIYTKCCTFYQRRNIPYFLFGPGMTIASVCKFGGGIVVINKPIIFENGAEVPCNFATNLMPDVMVMASNTLGNMIAKCASQVKKTKKLKAKRYPIEVLSVSDVQIISKKIDFVVKRDECIAIKKLEGCSEGFFGEHFLTSTKVAEAKEAAKEAAREAEILSLSPREKRIVNELNQRYDG